MNEKKSSRLRRAKRTRSKIKQLRNNRLCVFRTPRHIYAQIIAPNGEETLATASTLDKGVKVEVANGGNIEAAKAVGALIAQRAREKGIEEVAFDRSGYKYHGRIQALADAAREAGLKF